MHNKFKNGHRVIVYGFGQKNGKFYKNVPGIKVERDPFFLDYCVRFKNGTEDWILPQYLRKPYGLKRKRRKKYES